MGQAMFDIPLWEWSLVLVIVALGIGYFRTQEGKSLYYSVFWSVVAAIFWIGIAEKFIRA
jgi:hypothetical protein